MIILVMPLVITFGDVLRDAVEDAIGETVCNPTGDSGDAIVGDAVGGDDEDAVGVHRKGHNGEKPLKQ